MKKEEIFEGIDELALDLRRLEKTLREATNLFKKMSVDVYLLRAKMHHLENVSRSVEAQNAALHMVDDS